MSEYLNGLFNLKGKTAFLTGAGGHIVGELSLGFARAGCTVAVGDLRLHKAQAVVDKISAEGGSAFAIEIDVVKKDSWKTRSIKSSPPAVASTSCSTVPASTRPRPSSTSPSRNGTRSSPPSHRHHARLPSYWRAHGGSKSAAPLSTSPPPRPARRFPKAFAYSVAKAGVANLTQNVARELAPLGVRVNSLRPGFFPTDWNLKNFITEERKASILGHTPMGRFGEPVELVGAVLWMASGCRRLCHRLRDMRGRRIPRHDHLAMIKSVVVTGGTQGIGAAIAARFHRLGASVIIGARRDNGFAASLGDRARFVQADVTQAADHRRLVDAALETSGQLDLYVNNAGRSQWMPLDQITEEFWTSMLDVNARSVSSVPRPPRARSPRADPFSTSPASPANAAVPTTPSTAPPSLPSTASPRPSPRNSARVAFASMLSAPSSSRTPGLLEALNETPAPAGGDTEHFLSTFTQANASLGHLPTADQVAEFCQALVESTAITGQCINVDCGVFPQ